MDRLLHDVRFAVRQIRRRPMFALVASLSLAVGVGANTAIFSGVSALLLRPVPGVQEPDRVVEIGRTRPDGSSFDSFAYPDFVDLRDQVGALASAAAYTLDVFSLSRGGEGERIMGMFVSPAYFDVMGVRPERGRFFSADEDVPGSSPAVAVLSHAFWSEALGSDPDVLGSTVRVNRIPVEVVGIAPPDFQGHVIAFQPAVYLPLRAITAVQGVDASMFESRHASWHLAVGRLAPGADVAEADSQVRGVYARLADAYPESNAQRSGRVVPLGLVPGGGRGPVTAFLGVLMGMVGLILLVTCANVAGMFVARATAREREIAVRLSLGAGRARLVQQLVTEAVLVFLLGGVLGAGLGIQLLRMLPLDRLPVPIPIDVDLMPDAGVLAFPLALTLGTGVVFGLLPALQATRPDLTTSLKDDGSGRSGSGRLRRVFVAAQVGLSLILLAAAGLLLRGLQRAGDVETGFDARGAYLTGVDLDMEGYEPDEGRAFQRALVDRLNGLPGIEAAALAIDLPLDMGSHGTSVEPEGWTGPSGRDDVGVDFNHVSPGFFETLRIPVLQGRVFTDDDAEGSERVVVVSRTFVRQVWPEGSPLGRRMRVNLGVGEDWWTVVGIVEDVQNQMLTDIPEPFVYLPLWQAYRSDTKVVARAAGTVAAVAPVLRGAVLEGDPSLSLEPVISLQRYTGVGTLPQKLAAAITTGLGGLAVLLAGLGVYGVVAFSVTRRTREIGIRMALGAGRSHIVRSVLVRGLVLALPGLVVGAVGAVGVGYVLRFLLLGLSPVDPVALGGVAAVLLSVVGLASLVPGRRAANVQPAEALRAE